MQNAVIETRTARIWLGPDDILRVALRPEAKLTLADAEEHMDAVRQVSRGQLVPVLVDASHVAFASREGGAFVSRKGTEASISALALVFASPVSHMVSRIFVATNKTPYPTKIFASESEALAWLGEFVEST